MAITRFQLRRLALIGHNNQRAEVSFTDGLNVVSGPSDTGKTFIFQCIDYMLGGSKAPKPIPESEQYETVRLSLLTDSDGEIVLERSLKGGAFSLIREGQPDKILSAKHTSGDQGSVSNYLLNISGLSGKKIRTNKQGKTRDLSIRDLAKLILVDEETVISESSPILSGQYTTGTAEAAVFRLLLTGIDDGSLISIEDPKLAKGRKAGKVEMLEYLLEQARGRVNALQLPGDVNAWQEQLDQLDFSYETAKDEIAVEQKKAAELEEIRRDSLIKLRGSESRFDVLKELQHRFELLEQQYQSDLRRLESIAEAGVRLGQMSEERCPVCGAEAEHQKHEHQKVDQSPVDVAQSCLAEAEKIRSLLEDLFHTRMENDKEILQIHERNELLKSRINQTSIELDDLMKPRIENAINSLRDSQAARDVYKRAVELNWRSDELRGLLDNIKSSVTNKGEDLASARIKTDEAEEFCKEVEALLRDWHFPALDRVTFSEGDQDLVISGRTRASHGKGVRAIAHAAFNLALLKYCIKFSKPHPGFVLIDSPLVVYREPDSDEGDFTFDVKNAFYRSVSDGFGDVQVIIIENEDPPHDIDTKSNVIRFTGSDHGRKGFIPQQN